MFTWLFDLFIGLPNWAEIVSFITFLLIGILFLVKGADYFVDSASSLAKILGVSTLIIGLTIVSFGTSAPEASVSIFSQINNSSDISLGNVVGSNIFNTLVVLGMSAIYAPIIIHYRLVRREIPFMIVMTLILFFMALFFDFNGSNALLRIEGAILLVLFVGYLYMNYRNAKHGEEVVIDIDDDVTVMPLKQSIIFLLIGLVMIVAGGEFVVHGAKNTALQIGVSETMVGLTVVAIGTSLPELVTSVVAARKNENDIALGNVIGSNIFNILFILGIGSSIGVMTISIYAIYDFLILIGFTAIITFNIFYYKKIGKTSGIIYIGFYISYVIFVILREIL
ncbi:MAG: calcium/sodium antiporter [Candidatus Izimaplasma sp.]|nr:calcium/sodium antiporter [Candidatus Izimaplasma bacterium]